MSRANAFVIGQSYGFEDSSFTLLGRVRGSDRQLLQQADLTSISYVVTDLSDDSEVDSGTLTSADVISDTPVTDDDFWEAQNPGDTIGYNLEIVVPKGWCPNGSRTYQFEFTFQPTTGSDYEFIVGHKHTTTAKAG